MSFRAAIDGRRRGWRGAAALAAIVFAAAARPAVGQPAQDPRALVEAARLADESRRVLERLQRLEARSEALEAREEALRGELDRLRTDRRASTGEAERASAALGVASADLATTLARLDRLRANLDAERPRVAARIVALYKLGSLGYRRLLLEADDIRQAGRAYRLMATLSRRDRERFEEYRASLVELGEARDDLRSRVEKARALTVALADRRRAIDGEIAAGSERLVTIDEQQDLMATVANRLDLVRANLGGRLEAAPFLPLVPFKGDLDWPVSGRVVAPFGRQRASRFGTEVLSNGVDIAAGGDALARAVHEGRVAYAAPFDGYGRVVILDHGDGAYTLYGHLAELAVDLDTIVERGSALGRLAAGSEAGPRLYFELRIDGRPVDPLQWLRRFSPSAAQ